MVIGEIITITRGGQDLYEWYKDKRDEFLDINELDACRQRFAIALEKTLINSLDISPDLDQILDRYDAHREEILATLGDVNITNINDGVDRLTEQMADLVLEELDTDDINRDDLEKALQTAYREALDQYLKQTADNKSQRLNFELSRVLQDDIEEINNNLATLKDQLRYQPELLGRYEPFTIIDTATEWEESARIELIEDESYFQSYDRPPAFDDSADDHQVLVYGRKGTGKTRALYELLRESMQSHSFDKIILIKPSFTKERDIGSLTSLDYSGDVLLIWDDTQNVSNPDVVDNTINKLRDHLETVGDHELWTRAAVRREQLDAIFSESQTPSALTSIDDESGFGTIWETTIEVDTDDQFDSDTIARLVEETLEFYNLSATPQVREAFIDAICEYEPTPEYIRSASSSIAAQADGLTERNVEDLPESTRDIWEEAYRELRDTKYGDSRRAILKSLSLLDWINADRFPPVVVRAVYHTVFDAAGEFDADLRYLDSRGWITLTESADRIQIHDIRLEAIETPVDQQRIIDGFSKALEETAESGALRGSKIADEYASVLNANFASQVFETYGDAEVAKLIEKHFGIATRQTEATPSVHQSYAEYLEHIGRFDEAQTQHLIAKEIRPTESAVDREFRQFVTRVSEQLDEWELADPIEEPQRRDHDTSQPSYSNHETLGESGNYRSDATKCEICKQPIEPGRTRCKIHEYDPVDPPSPRDRAEAFAHMERQEYLKTKENILEIELSESLHSNRPDRNLMRELRQLREDIPHSWIQAVENSDTSSGLITKLRPVAKLLKQYRNTDHPQMAVDHFDPSGLDTYGQTVCRELLSEKQLLGPLGDNTVSQLLIAEIDTGQEIILALLEPEDVTELTGLTTDQMKELCLEEMDMDAHLTKIRPQIVGSYCELVEYKGQPRDDLVIMDATGSDTTLAVATTTVPHTVDLTESAALTAPAQRAIVSEITAATAEFTSDRSLGSSGSALLPTGARSQRVCVTGILTEPTAFETLVGWGAVLHDPFGQTVSVYQVGSTTLEERLDRIDFPTTVLLTGEIETVTMDDGGPRAVLMIDDLSEITTATLFISVIETCQQTLDRIAQFDADPGISQLSRYRYEIDSAADLDEYEDMAEDAIQKLS